MHRAGSRLATAILLIACIGSIAQAATIDVSVFEVTKNATMVPYASIFINGALAGKTGSDGTLTITYAGTGSVEIKVAKPGYDDWFGSAGPNTSSVVAKLMKKNLTVTVDVYDADTLRPVPGAVVGVTRQDSAVTGATDANGTVTLPVTAGMAYTIDINAIGYQTRTSQIEMGITAQSFQYPLLLDDRFSLVVTDEKDQAALEDVMVYIDGNPVGRTDARGVLVLQVPRDKVYNFRLVRTGYKDYTEKRLIGGNEAIVPIILQRSPTRVVLSVIDENGNAVQGASVFIDGSLRGTTSGNGLYSPVSILEGNYSVEVRHPGFITAKKQVVVGGKADQIPVVLAFEDVNLTILVEDRNHRILEGATVSLNQNATGKTDSRGVLQVRINPDTIYNVTVSKQGYLDGHTTKEIEFGNTSSTLTVTLSPDNDWMLLLAVGLAVAVVICVVILVVRRVNRNRGRSGSRGRGL